jgi:hypothetical protein
MFMVFKKMPVLYLEQDVTKSSTFWPTMNRCSLL